MRLTIQGGAFECEYDVDDETGRLNSVGCSPRDREPIGYGRDVLGWQDEAGEQDQTPSGWDSL